ncbi:MAG: hypothetical protein M3305_13545 [Actinomycetota bacterium]|nr:hypothetical protein [Actinomycetota bacterium]
MLRRLVRDESGVALGLAVIMIALIGVMGAGLLVFVRNDLEAVVEVNQGQRAFNIADAGVQAAKHHLLGDKAPAHYDVDSASNPLYYAASCNVGDESAAPALQGPSWSPEGSGVTRNFADGQFNVTIRWLSPDSAADNRCKAPQTGTLPGGVDYFEVISTGTYGSATRRVEAIYSTYDLNIPKGYFTQTGDIKIAGSACIDSVSLFTLYNVTLSGGGSGCDGTGQNIKGRDRAYGNWRNSVNPTPRSTDNAGFGAAGMIDSRLKASGRDYDKDTCPKLLQNLSDPSVCPSPGRITFPFAPGSQPDIDFLREEAIRQEQEDPATQRHYYNPSNGNFSLSNWPDNSSENTIVFVEFSGASSSNTVKWDVSGSCTDNPPKKGTLVVRNGNFTTQPNRARLQGVVIVRGGEVADGTSADTGKTCLEGFVNAQGTITIAGNVSPFTSNELADERPGFYGARLWSWRELYQ